MSFIATTTTTTTSATGAGLVARSTMNGRGRRTHFTTTTTTTTTKLRKTKRRSSNKHWMSAFGGGDNDDDLGGGAYEIDDFRGVNTGGGSKQMQRDRLGYTKSRNSNRDTYEYAPTRRGGTSRNRSNNTGRFDEDEYERVEQREGGGGGSGGRRNNNGSSSNQQRPRLFPRELDKFLVAGAFVVGIGAGVVFDTAVDLEPSNVASREILDRRTPSSEVCMANGASAMVFDQRVFLSLNPFNVYVAQPEVKPGCVLRRSNWSVLEREKVVTQDQENDCKRNLNTFAYVGDLKKSPEVSCVYHSEEAENQFMKDPSKAVLGDGVRGSEKGKNIAGGGGGSSSNKSFR